jgi:hypothetical protein
MYTIRINQNYSTLFFLDLHCPTGLYIGGIGSNYKTLSNAKRWAKYWAEKLSFESFEFKDKINGN